MLKAEAGMPCGRHSQEFESSASTPGRSSQLDTSCSAQQPGLTCAVFILFSWNYDLFWTSLQTYMAAGWGRRIVIVDNSADKRIVHDARVPTCTLSCPPGTCPLKGP